MRLRFRTALAAWLLAAGPLAAQTPVAPAPRPVPVVTAAYQLRNAAAADLAAALAMFLRPDSPGADVRADAPRNEVVVAAGAATHGRVARLVADLDRTPPLIHIAALVAEVPPGFLVECGLTTPGRAMHGGFYALPGRELAMLQTALRHYPGREVLARPEVLVQDNQTGHVRVGNDIPVGPGDQRFVGVCARITPRVMPDGGLLLRLGTEVSTPVASPVVLRPGAVAFPFNVSTTQTNWTVPAGCAVVAALPTTGGDGKPAAVLFVLTPTVVKTAEQGGRLP